jgi:hypothetical protein
MMSLRGESFPWMVGRMLRNIIIIIIMYVHLINIICWRVNSTRLWSINEVMTSKHTHTHTQYANNKVRQETVHHKMRQSIENYLIIMHKIKFTHLIVFINTHKYTS